MGIYFFLQQIKKRDDFKIFSGKDYESQSLLLDNLSSFLVGLELVGRGEKKAKEFQKNAGIFEIFFGKCGGISKIGNKKNNRDEKIYIEAKKNGRK